MKNILNNLYNDEADKLLFDYLEGNLSKEAAAELEDNLASNLTLQEELKHWTESYIEEDFFDTILLEEQLQKTIIRNKRYSAESYILIVALITSCLSFLPFTLEKEQVQSKEIVQPEPDNNISTLNESVATFNHQIELNAPQIAVKANLNDEKPFRTNPSLIQKEDEIRVEFIEPLPFNSRVLNKTMSVDEKMIKGYSEANEKPVGQKKEFSSKVSRKEQRSIERAKEKALQKRIEEQYIRGRKPYVVPLNPNF